MLSDGIFTHPVSLKTSGALWAGVSFAAFGPGKALHAGEALLTLDAGGALDAGRTLQGQNTMLRCQWRRAAPGAWFFTSPLTDFKPDDSSVAKSRKLGGKASLT